MAAAKRSMDYSEYIANLASGGITPEAQDAKKKADKRKKSDPMQAAAMRRLQRKAQ